MKRKELELEVVELRKDLKEALGALANGHSLEEEKANMAAEEVEAVKKKQRRHIAKLFAMRMKKVSLLRGWNAWKAMREERLRTMRNMRRTALRLLQPKQVAVFRHWRALWAQAQRRAAMSTHERELEDEREKRVAAEEELAELQKEMSSRIDEGRAGASEEMQLKLAQQQQQALEAEREKQVAFLQQKAARRIMQGTLARGMTAWVDMHEEAARKESKELEKQEELARKLAKAADREVKRAEEEVKVRSPRCMAR